jgi:hypothetical protein
VVDHLPVYGPDGGAVALMRAVGVWTWLIAAFGVAVVVLGGFLLA